MEQGKSKLTDTGKKMKIIIKMINATGEGAKNRCRTSKFQGPR